MNVLIIEDEELAVKKLIKTLESIDTNIRVLANTDSILSSVEWLEKNPAPDLILMDIELADGQSFEIFKKTTVHSPVIFTTSYDEHALKAFKVNSVDYLLKPIQKDELKAALEKFQRTIQSDVSTLNINNLFNELEARLKPKEYRKRFLVKMGQKLNSVETKDIAYFYSDDRINLFKTYDNKKFIVDYTMDELETMLDPDHYFRISRSFYVSINSIEKIEDYFGNRLILNLNPIVDKQALVSRERVSDFKKWMGK